MLATHVAAPAVGKNLRQPRRARRVRVTSPRGAMRSGSEQACRCVRATAWQAASRIAEMAATLSGDDGSRGCSRPAPARQFVAITGSSISSVRSWSSRKKLLSAIRGSPGHPPTTTIPIAWPFARVTIPPEHAGSGMGCSLGQCDLAFRVIDVPDHPAARVALPQIIPDARVRLSHRMGLANGPCTG